MTSVLEIGVSASLPVVPAGKTTGTPPEALATRGGHLAPMSPWQALIDELLRWKRDGAKLFDPSDVPAPEIIETALDFAVDQSENKGPVPTSAAPSGGGFVMFEWRDGPVVGSLEFVRSGMAEWTQFRNHQVTHEATLERNPLTRNLERRR